MRRRARRELVLAVRGRARDRRGADVFEFEVDGARIRGKIDRIGPVPDGGTRITDYKTGRSDNAGRPPRAFSSASTTSR